jgi:hypothetical protein
MPNFQSRRSLFQRLLSRVAGNFLYSASIELVEGNADCVVLKVSGRMFTANATTREIWSEGQVVGQFDAIKSVVITRLLGRGGIVWWVLDLSMHDGGDIFVGRTPNDAEASVAAARLGTILGVQVLAPALGIRA